MTTTRVRHIREFDVLILTSLIWFLGKFVRYAFPPLFETLGTHYGVSRTELGAAFTGLMIVYAVMQLPSGLFADRIGPVRVITFGSILTALGALSLVVDSPYLVLVAAMAVMGAGTGTYKTVAVPLLSRTYPERTGRALGVFDTLGTFGGGAAPAAVVVVVTVPSIFGSPWRTLFLLAGVTSLLLGIMFAVCVPDRLRSSSQSRSDEQVTDAKDTSPPRQDDGFGSWTVYRYAAKFRELHFSGFVVVTVLFSFTYNGAVAFLPLYLSTETALSSVTANLLFSALFVVSLVQLLTGEVSDRIGPLPVITLTLGIASTGLVAIIALSDVAGTILLSVAVITLGLGAHGFRPVRGAYLMESIPPALTGGSFAIVRTLIMVAGAIAPVLVGYLSETVGFRPAFGVLAVSLILATVLMIPLWAIE